jgi:environmental stress-induced protein Ves
MYFKTYKDYKKSEWSGGSTTELYIRPDNGNYSTLDFKLRISLAKVKVSKTAFTPLKGVSRKLMVLQGEIILKHEHHHSQQLRKFDVDSFEGSWNTTSIGHSTNFNVMSLGALKNLLYGEKMRPKSNSHIDFDKKWNNLFIYVFRGNLEVEIKQKTIMIESGSLIEIFRTEQISFNTHSKRGCEIAIVKTA